MSGCFGNDPEDRARERELDRYLAEAYRDDDEEDDDWPDEDDRADWENQCRDDDAMTEARHE